MSLNEDNSHYFYARAGKKLDTETLAFIDQYAATQVRKLMLSATSQADLHGYDPDGPNNQRLFRSLASEQRPSARKGAHGRGSERARH